MISFEFPLSLTLSVHNELGGVRTRCQFPKKLLHVMSPALLDVTSSADGGRFLVLLCLCVQLFLYLVKCLYFNSIVLVLLSS